MQLWIVNAAAGLETSRKLYVSEWPSNSLSGKTADGCCSGRKKRPIHLPGRLLNWLFPFIATIRRRCGLCRNELHRSSARASYHRFSKYKHQCSDAINAASLVGSSRVDTSSSVSTTSPNLGIGTGRNIPGSGYSNPTKDHMSQDSTGQSSYNNNRCVVLPLMVLQVSLEVVTLPQIVHFHNKKFEFDKSSCNRLITSFYTFHSSSAPPLGNFTREFFQFATARGCS